MTDFDEHSEPTRNLTDEESEIFDSWLQAEAVKTGISLLDPISKAEWIEQSECVIRGKTVDGEAVEVSIVSAKCSACGKYSEHVNQMPPYMKYEYCPHCGRRIL